MFVFNGISSKDMKVIIEEEDNLISRAAWNYEKNEDNSFSFNNFSSLESNLKLYVMDISKISDIYEWLNGKGILEYKEKITTAYFLDEIKPQRAASIKTIDLNYKRDPFWYKKNDDYVECTTNVTNEGNVFSKPLIKLVKQASSTVDITINGVRFKYSFPDSENYVIIDCFDCNAFYENLYRNSNLEIDFSFPQLNPGLNSITFNSGSCQILFKKKDRWI